MGALMPYNLNVVGVCVFAVWVLAHSGGFLFILDIGVSMFFALSLNS